MKTTAHRKLRLPALLGAALLLVFHATTADERKVALQAKRTWEFPEAGVRFTNEFAQARLNNCEQTGPDTFRLTISPENEPINPSPWYAFKVSSEAPRTLTLQFAVTANGSVLRPRLSRDGKEWTLIDKEAFSPKEKSRDAVAKIQTGPKPLWVAAQEFVGVTELEAWMDRKVALPFASGSIVGHSIEGRPIRELTFGKSSERVFIIGRQHPPEVTGSIGLMAFVDTISGGGELAEKFRLRFQTTVLPLVNPDGVVHGHWRSNLGGVDTNRDWKPFTQPESRAVRDALLKLGGEAGAKPFLFLDFHSTGKDIFYGQADSEPTVPPLFARKWLAAIHERFPDYTFAREDGHNAGKPTSKAWAYETFGIPAITYELGYETDRALIRKVCSGAAEEMMRILLAEPRAAVTAPPAPR
jgi:cytosolic carboxypeptidase protein 6